MPPRVSKGVRASAPPKPPKDIFAETMDQSVSLPPLPAPAAVPSMAIQLLVALNLLAVFGFYVVYYRIDQQSQAIQALTTLVTQMNLNVPAAQIEQPVPTSTPPEVTLPIVAAPTTTEPMTAATTTVAETGVQFLKYCSLSQRVNGPGYVVGVADCGEYVQQHLSQETGVATLLHVSDGKFIYCDYAGAGGTIPACAPFLSLCKKELACPR
jgi:hypothetical protein